MGAPPSRRRVDIGSIINSRQRDVANSELKSQMKFLEDIIRRLSEELSRQQAASPAATHAPKDAGPGFLDGTAEGAPLPLWLTDPQYLSPILVAYDQRLSEAEVGEKKHIDEMVALKESAQGIVGENVRLRGELEHYMALLAKRTEADDVGSSLAQTQQVLERLDLLSEENNLLLQQQGELDTEISHLHRQLEARTAESVKLGRDLTGALSKLNRTEAELEHARDGASETRKRLKVSDERLQHATEEVARLKKELAQATAAGGKARALLEEASQAYSALQAEHAALQARDREVAGGAVGLSRELQALQDRHGQSVTEAEQARAEAAQLRELLAAMEARVSEYQAKEVEVFQRIQEAQQAAEEAKSARDGSSGRERQLALEVEDMQRQLRDVRDQVARRVEQAHREAADSVATRVASLAADVHRLEAALAEARSAVERAGRDTRGAASERDQLRSQLAAGPEVPGLMRGQDARAEVEKLERERDEAREAARSTELAMQRATQEWERERRSLEAAAAETQRHQAVAEAEAEDLRGQARQARHLLEALQKEHRQLLRDRASGESRLQQQLDGVVAEHRSEARVLETKLEQAVALYNRASTEAETILDAKEAALSKLREEAKEAALRYESLSGELSAQLEEERARAADLAGQVKQMQLDAAGLEGDLRVAMDASKKAQPRIENAERRAAEASAQVVALLTSEEDLLRQKKDLHAALDRMTLERARAERQLDQLQSRQDSSRRQLEAFQEAAAVGGTSGGMLRGLGGEEGAGGRGGAVADDLMRELERRARYGGSGERRERRRSSSRSVTERRSVVRMERTGAPDPIAVP